MDELTLRALLEAVREGGTTIEDAVTRLKDLPFADLGFAHVDHHRALRVGFPEVIYGPGKTEAQIVAITRAIAERGQTTLATRVSEPQVAALLAAFPDVEHHPAARVAILRRGNLRPIGKKPLCVVAAGTSDLPVAEEAAITAETLGATVERVYDVGVAGLHRLLAKRAKLEAAGVIIVVAGMEAALASVVGGLVSVPVIAVPTSVGYGASFAGVTALLSMLNSCASGVTVVNIDNGFGAAYAACLVQRSISS